MCACVCVCVCVCVHACVCVCVCVCVGGMRLLFCLYKGACFFLAKQMWTIPHNLTAGEVLFTTYMVVVLFLERPALLSVQRPQTSPSSYTALQLQKVKFIQQRKGMQVTYDVDLVNTAKSRLYLGLVCSPTRND